MRTLLHPTPVRRRARAPDHSRRVEPFHFSPRYSGQDAQMIVQVMAAFAGSAP